MVENEILIGAPKFVRSIFTQVKFHTIINLISVLFTESVLAPQMAEALLYLPSANEVWGKVIFSQAFVILSSGGGGTHAPLPGGY